MTKRQVSGRDILRAALLSAENIQLTSAASKTPFDPTPYLTEVNRVITTTNSACSITDALKPIPLPHHRPYIPTRRGIDVGVEVENAYVFRFDHAVASTVQVLVDKSVEQAVMELNEEKQLRAIRGYKQGWEGRRAEEIREAAAIEAEETKKAAEHAAVLKAGKEKLAKQRRLANKVKAMKVSVEFVSLVFNKTLEVLEQKSVILPTPITSVIESVRHRHACNLSL